MSARRPNVPLKNKAANSLGSLKPASNAAAAPLAARYGGSFSGGARRKGKKGKKSKKSKKTTKRSKKSSKRSTRRR
jgi:hypothetical protein